MQERLSLGEKAKENERARSGRGRWLKKAERWCSSQDDGSIWESSERRAVITGLPTARQVGHSDDASHSGLNGISAIAIVRARGSDGHVQANH